MSETEKAVQKPGQYEKVKNRHRIYLNIVRAWNLSETMEQVMRALGLTRPQLSRYVLLIRKKGVKLKALPDERSSTKQAGFVDFDELRAVAAELLPEGATVPVLWADSEAAAND